MTNATFFDESKEQSQVKSVIVSKYFWAWARVIIGAQNRRPQNADKRIAYIDLFAGPGRYSDGTTSTPLLILKKAIEDDVMRQRLVTLFNDKDERNTQSLSKAISKLSGVATLKHRPQVDTEEVGENMVKWFEEMNLIPTLFFVDPWGYKGLSLRLVNSVLKDWGCDCIFFFNYNRINMGLSNDAVRDHMNALFGKRRVNTLRKRLRSLTPEQRELTIIEELRKTLRKLGREYVLPFRFKADGGSRTSHYLIFVSKVFKGYEIMKEIMAKESSATEQGVANFEYSPVAARMATQQLLPFQLTRPLDELGVMLLREFAGQTLTMDEIYKRHNINRPYIRKNYKDVLKQLAAHQKIAAPSHQKKGTFADHVQVIFPVRKGTNNG